jgi:hypothetical protein
MKMKIDISYMHYKKYGNICGHYWFFMFKRYTFVKGFIVRIFGVYINFREKNAFEKLIKINKKWYENKK